jgi:spore coat protein CotH
VPRMVLSELMYHPVLEEAVDEHEFVEIHNAGDGKADLGGWKLRIDGTDRFTFAPGTTVEPGQYRVIARNRDALAAVPGYGLHRDELLGDYQGELGNDGGTVALVDATGADADAVKYDDRWPWPAGADGLGAGEAWLPAEQLPLLAHRGRGRSLERYSFSVSGRELRNWEASPLDGATPGRPNHATGEPPAAVTALSATAPGGAAIDEDQPVSISAALSEGAVSDLAVEYFVDALGRTDEVSLAVPMTEQAPRFVATIPPLPQGSIVRYRVIGRRAGQPQVLSPRPSDPFAWHAYFVNPPLPAGRTFQLLIAPTDWTAMWTNLAAYGAAAAAPNYGCLVNPTWDSRVPAVLVVDGKVYDVRVRYQGGRAQRAAGNTIPGWSAPGPAQPAPLRALSWSLSFPRYAPIGKRRQVILKKNYQACPGVLNAALSELYWEAGVPADRFDFVRLHVNGGYYDYMIDVDPLNEDVLQRQEEGRRAGELFKADGWSRDEGPWGPSDFSPLQPNCAFDALERYATTYQRQTNTWKEGRADPDLLELIAAIGRLDQAKAGGLPALRAALEATFDVDQLLTVTAMRNFLGAWDDAYHNYQLYKRPADGKWLLLPQDFDQELGGDPNGRWPTFAHPPSSSLYAGEAGNGSNRLPYINRIKDALFKSYRPEFERRLRELAAGVLAPDNVIRVIDEADARFSRADWRASPAVKECNVDARVQAARTWIRERHLALRYLGVR